MFLKPINSFFYENWQNVKKKNWNLILIMSIENDTKINFTTNLYRRIMYKKIILYILYDKKIRSSLF